MAPYSAGNMPGLACMKTCKCRRPTGKALIVPAEPILGQHVVNKRPIKESSEQHEMPSSYNSGKMKEEKQKDFQS